MQRENSCLAGRAQGMHLVPGSEPSPNFWHPVLVIWWIVHYSMVTKDLALRQTRNGGSNLGCIQYLLGVKKLRHQMRVELLPSQWLLKLLPPYEGN